MFLRTTFAALAVLLAANRGQAQVEANRTKLSLDTSLLAYDYQHIESDDVTLVQRNLTVGPASTGGISAGYSLSRRLVPQLYVSLAYAQSTFEQEYAGEREYDKVDALKYEVRPALEITLLPESRIVPYVVAGASVGGSSVVIAGETLRAVGLGGALGVGLHAFVVPEVSADISFTYRLLGMIDDDRDSLLEDPRNLVHSLFLNAGVSLWL